MEVEVIMVIKQTVKVSNNNKNDGIKNAIQIVTNEIEKSEIIEVKASFVKGN